MGDRRNIEFGGWGREGGRVSYVLDMSTVMALCISHNCYDQRRHKDSAYMIDPADSDRLLQLCEHCAADGVNHSEPSREPCKFTREPW